MKLTAEDLHFSYDGQTETVAGVSLSLEPGCLTLLLGPNGCGKTTLLRLLTGELRPAAGGEVQLDGQGLRQWDNRRRARALGVVMQSAPPALDFTVRELVTMGRMPHFSALSGPAAADREIIDAALAQFELSSLAGRRGNALSGGERQRVMLAAAWANEPEILLTDEPTSAMDPSHADKTLRVLKERSRRRAVLIISHDLQKTANLADRILLMKAGRLIAAGTRDEVLTAANLRKLYEMDFTILRTADGRLAFLPAGGGSIT